MAGVQAARERYRSNIDAMNNYGREAIHGAIERHAVNIGGRDSSSLEQYTGEEMVTVRTADGLEITMTRRDAERQGLLRGQERQETFHAAGQSGADAFASSSGNALSGFAGGGRTGSVARQFVSEMLGSARSVGSKLAIDLLKPAFTDMGKAMMKNIKGLDLSAKSLAIAALGLQGLANILGAGGKRKQTNSIIGAGLGLIAGSLLPGINLLEGAAIGAGALGMFAGGGSPPMGRMSVVGERGPELFVPSTPGTILTREQVAAVQGRAGGGGIVNNFYGDIHDRMDLELVTRQQDLRRERESLVS